ncbi:MAG: XRE family transcriptional regulator [Candidatus Omnitrophota bacterium]|nr:XRE family transcriptional regulator [Candidatus Omnitrophota bacterium]
MNLGQRIKELRGPLRQQEFAKRCRIDASTINKIEKGTLIGTLDIHIKICQALGISLSTLYKNVYEEKINPFESISQPEEKPLTYNKQVVRHILAKDILFNKKMLPEILMLESGGLVEDKLHPDSQKFIFVLEGKIAIETKKDKYTLNPDQSLYITDASIEHSLRNIGSTTAKLLTVTHPVIL